jgi:hypothetical protein
VQTKYMSGDPKLSENRGGPETFQLARPRLKKIWEVA